MTEWTCRLPSRRDDHRPEKTFQEASAKVNGTLERPSGSRWNHLTWGSPSLIHSVTIQYNLLWSLNHSIHPFIMYFVTYSSPSSIRNKLPINKPLYREQLYEPIHCHCDVTYQYITIASYRLIFLCAVAAVIGWSETVRGGSVASNTWPRTIRTTERYDKIYSIIY